ncbi:MAG: hypothetical protein GC191_06175 [Azospirillum sp.]|nr:hypothetical protein [Azospirillum sp.]
MIKMLSPLTGRNTRTAAVLVVAMLAAACAPLNSAPVQVQANNPSVTYKYRGDQELLQANQNATTYCSRYSSSAQTANITDSPDGTKTVVFQCIAIAPGAAPTQPYNSNLAYNYRSDQDLLDASRNAENYCMSNGVQRAMSTGITNTNGNKTASFQCTSR